MKLLISSLVALSAFGTAAYASAATAAKPLFQLPSDVVSGNNQFAIDLYRQLGTSPDKPLFFSPYSISTALAMTYAGARGDTATEMAKTLHFTLPADQLAAAYGAAMKQLTAAAPAHGYQFRIANRLWGQQGYKFLEPFLKITRDDFAAPLEQLDFAEHADAARTTINAWVAEQTNDKIKDLIGAGSLDAATRLVLTNAIYFKGDWALPFEKDSTQKAPFHLTAEKTADVELMYQQAHFRFASTNDALLLEMPYKGRDLSMVVVLPTKVDGLPALEKTFTAENYAAWTAKLASKPVRVWMPKFQATEEMQLADTLAGMGMPSAFTSGKADFSGMDGAHDLYISHVIHKAYVNVDEKGTEAAAATAIVMRATAVLQQQPPEEFKADHPFIYVLRDTRSGVILFIGRYLGPS